MHNKQEVADTAEIIARQRVVEQAPALGVSLSSRERPG